MYSNVGTLIRQKAMRRIRWMLWVVTPIIAWPFIECLFLYVYRAAYCFFDIEKYSFPFLSEYSINSLISALLFSVFYSSSSYILKLILYPIESVIPVFYGAYNNWFDYSYWSAPSYWIIMSVVQLLKIVVVFFAVRAYFREKYMLLYAFGERVENVSFITKLLLAQRGFPTCIHGVGTYYLENGVIVLSPAVPVSSVHN